MKRGCSTYMKDDDRSIPEAEFYTDLAEDTCENSKIAAVAI